MTGSDAETLSAGSFTSINRGRLRLRGHELPRTFLDRSGQKYCPVCVEKDHDIHRRTWGRALWQIDSIHVCADHGVVLGRLGNADYPRSQHDFAGRMVDHQQLVERRTPAEVGRSARNFARYLSNRLLKDDSGNKHSWLDDLPVDVAARFCENIGALVTHGSETRPHDLEHRDLIAVGAAGIEVCQKGPDAVWEAYDDIRRRSPNAKGGFSVDFGFYIRWLQR